MNRQHMYACVFIFHQYNHFCVYVWLIEYKNILKTYVQLRSLQGAMCYQCNSQRVHLLAGL